MRVQTLAEHVGNQFRSIRIGAGITLEQFAAAMTLHTGMSWSSGRTGDFESGRVAISFATLFGVARTLSALLGRPVGLSEFFGDVGEVELRGGLVASAEELRSAVDGGGVQAERNDSSAITEADRRVCRQVGVSVDVMQRVWGRSFSAERDARAAGGNAQKKGQVARSLKLELSQLMSGKS